MSPQRIFFPDRYPACRKARDHQVLQEQLREAARIRAHARSPARPHREAVIECFKFWALRKVGRTTVNRYLATWGKGLRYAWRKLKIIGKAPVIEQYQNERQVEYVVDANTYQVMGRQRRRTGASPGKACP